MSEAQNTETASADVERVLLVGSEARARELVEKLRRIARYTEVTLGDSNRRALDEAADFIEQSLSVLSMKE